MVQVAGAGVRVMRVLEVEVVIARLDRVDGNPPGLFVLHPGGKAILLGSPPGFFGLELLKADRLSRDQGICPGKSPRVKETTLFPWARFTCYLDTLKRKNAFPFTLTGSPSQGRLE